MMFIALYDTRVVYWSLFSQLLTLCFLSVGFAIKDMNWGGSALLGGLSVWLSSVFFMLFIWYYRVYTSSEGKIAWLLALSEVIKIISMIVLLMISLKWLNVVFLPLILAYLAVWVVHVVISVIINYRINFN